MADVLNEKEIKAMREGGAMLSRVLKSVIDAADIGVSIHELDELAERLIRQGGGEPSFKGYKARHGDTAFPATLCVSINEEVVHGPGSRKINLKDGDILSLDIGVWYEGMCTDMAATVAIGKVSEKEKQLIEVTKRSLLAGIGAIKDDTAVSEIGRAVENYVKPYGFGIVRDFVGHGVGRKVHEDPHIPNFYDPRYDKIRLKAGMTVAVEPMITVGDWRVKSKDDGWTVITADGSKAAHFEVTVLVTEKGFDFITPLVI